MPVAAPTRCNLPTCPRMATRRGRCDEHQRKAWGNPSANTRALSGGERNRFRAETLANHPTCCWPGCTEPATEADHVIPIGEGGARLDQANAQGLCEAHHDLKTIADTARMRQRRRRPR